MSGAFADYKIIKGKRYLRTNDWPDKYVEVEILEIEHGTRPEIKYLKVCPVVDLKTNKINILKELSKK